MYIVLKLQLCVYHNGPELNVIFPATFYCRFVFPLMAVDHRKLSVYGDTQVYGIELGVLIRVTHQIQQLT
jgi:hypothetical protein